MRNKSAYTALLGVLMVMAILMAGCVVNDTRESTSEYVDDSTITANVRAAIYNEPGLVVGDISVETYRGIVQLGGFVNSTQASFKAADAARAVRGVKGVNNNLVVK